MLISKRKSRIEVIQETVIFNCNPTSNRTISVGARLTRLGDEELLCTFMRQRALGQNDFMPVACRSTNLGITWSAPQPLWSNHSDYDSVFGSVSPQLDSSNQLLFFGIDCPVDVVGETNWQVDGLRLKQNKLFYAVSDDLGKTWSNRVLIPKPTAGSAEAPGAMCVTRTGRWVISYSVYDSFDKTIHAPHEELWCLYSDDKGQTWRSSRMMQFAPHDGTAESWVIELADGRLLGACWHVNHTNGSDYPTPYVISSDEGVTWNIPRPLGVHGQALGLAALPNGQALLVYNQRRKDPVGVQLTILELDGDQIRIVDDQSIWQASKRKQAGDKDNLENWTDFGFGEPSVLPLSSEEALVVFWCNQTRVRGIVAVRVKLS